MVKRSRKILIGGVPFGRNNVGDEAILQCSVETLREVFPGAHLTVSTDDGAFTRRKLRVDTVPLFGFGHHSSRELMRKVMKEHDLFIWSGATGLSDYPEIPLGLLQMAQKSGTRTALWGVGMNNRINPVHYKVFPGRRKQVLDWVSQASFGSFDAAAALEQYRMGRICRKITRHLNAADLVVLRDPQSGDVVRNCGPVEDLVVGADAAVKLQAAELQDIALAPSVVRLLESKSPKVGVCISAQQQLLHCDGLRDLLDRLVAELGVQVLFVPMNPVTDAALMTQMLNTMSCPSQAAVLSGYYEPEEVLSVVGNLDLIISSRLHLLIFASIMSVPMIGIARGSKIDNFLSAYGLKAAGDVEECDFEHMWEECRYFLSEGKTAFYERSQEVRQHLLERFDAAQAILRELD